MAYNTDNQFKFWKDLKRKEIVPAVHGLLEKPHINGTYPAVIILYGAMGWRPEYVSIAKELADSGFVVLVLDYYTETKKDEINTDVGKNWPRWKAMIRSAVAYLQEDPSVKIGSVGLMGYSRGAYLAISSASSMPEVRAVVDYFGGGSSEKDVLESQVKNFPPLIILHDEADEAVPVSLAYTLRDAVIGQGEEVELNIYPNAKHGFNATWSPYYSEPYAIDSFRRAVDFLRRKL